MFFSPMFKGLLVRVNNSNKKGLKAVPINPYLKIQNKLQRVSQQNKGSFPAGGTKLKIKLSCF